MISVLSRASVARYGCRVARLHTTSIAFARNEPQFDDAEIMADKLNNEKYLGKRSKHDFQWTERPEAEIEKEYADKVEKMAKLYAVLQGFLLLTAIGAVGTAYLKWPQIKNWWLTEDIHVDDQTIEKLIQKNERKRLNDIPFVPAGTPDSSVPGVYYWGQRLGIGSKKAISKYPLRVSHFDGMKLRDVALTNSKYYGNLAIDESGNLLEWDLKDCKPILKDQDLTEVKVSNDVAYGLNRRGEILIIPLLDENLRLKNIEWKTSLLFPWKKYCRYSWKLDTKSTFHYSGENKVVQFDTGCKHLVLLSNCGKAYTCATGIKSDENNRSKGQFGIPNFSQFDPYPVLNKVYEIELLNTGIAGDHVTSRNITKIACGDYHTLACDLMGELYSFGLNTYGQLGQPISYDMEYVPFPKKVSTFSGHFDRQNFLKCVDIHCSGDTSYASILPQDVHRYFKDKNASIDDDYENLTYFAFGNGIHGQLGNGHYKHSQAEPTKIKVINGILTESSEKKNKRIRVADWYCGHEHTFIRLDNNEILSWGCNEFGQLGNGKRVKWDRPAFIPKLLEPGIKYNSSNIEELFDGANRLILCENQKIRAGENSSCLFWQA